jgi:hypothetical protein
LGILQTLTALQIDQFHSEYSNFEREVHILILGTLDAANKRLEAEFDEDTAKITAGLDEATVHGNEPPQSGED